MVIRSKNSHGKRFQGHNDVIGGHNDSMGGYNNMLEDITQSYNHN
jgi:hypothetical protein